LTGNHLSEVIALTHNEHNLTVFSRVLYSKCLGDDVAAPSLCLSVYMRVKRLWKCVQGFPVTN